MLALLSAAELLGMSLWFAGSAVAPMLRAAWNLSDAQVGWLTTAVQLGFVAGTAVAARLAFAADAQAGAVLDALTVPANTITISGSTNITTATGFNLVDRASSVPPRGSGRRGRAR